MPSTRVKPNARSAGVLESASSPNERPVLAAPRTIDSQAALVAAVLDQEDAVVDTDAEQEDEREHVEELQRLAEQEERISAQRQASTVGNHARHASRPKRASSTAPTPAKPAASSHVIATR